MKLNGKKLCLGLGMLTLFSGLAYTYQFNFGALSTNELFEDKLTYGAQRNFNLTRQELQVPSVYGRLVSITSNNKQTALWFEAKDGSIRNVNIEANNPVILSRKGELN